MEAATAAARRLHNNLFRGDIKITVCKRTRLQCSAVPQPFSECICLCLRFAAPSRVEWVLGPPPVEAINRRALGVRAARARERESARVRMRAQLIAQPGCDQEIKEHCSDEVAPVKRRETRSGLIWVRSTYLDSALSFFSSSLFFFSFSQDCGMTICVSSGEMQT